MPLLGRFRGADGVYVVVYARAMRVILYEYKPTGRRVHVRVRCYPLSVQRASLCLSPALSILPPKMNFEKSTNGDIYRGSTEICGRTEFPVTEMRRNCGDLATSPILCIALRSPLPHRLLIAPRDEPSVRATALDPATLQRKLSHNRCKGEMREIEAHLLRRLLGL